MSLTMKQLRRKLHQCVDCGQPAGIQARCPDHQQTWRRYHWRRGQQRRKAARQKATRQARWDAPGPNLVACCGGTLHHILIVPGNPPVLIAACCRRVLGVIPTEEVQP